MKYLLIFSLTLLIGCGKDNKSGDIANPPTINPINGPHHEFLVGRWADLGSCEQVRARRGERRSMDLFERFEIHFYPTHGTTRSGNLEGNVFNDNVEFIGPCQTGRPLKAEIHPKRYIVVNDGIVIPSDSGRNRDDRKFQIRIIDQNRIIYSRGYSRNGRNVEIELTRISSQPGL